MTLNHNFTFYWCILGDFELLGFAFEGEFYMDQVLPVGCSMSCVAFEKFSSFLEWAVRRHTGLEDTVHYLDYFLCVGHGGSGQCARLLSRGMRANEIWLGLDSGQSKQSQIRLGWNHPHLKHPSFGVPKSFWGDSGAPKRFDAPTSTHRLSLSCGFPPSRRTSCPTPLQLTQCTNTHPSLPTLPPDPPTACSACLIKP